MLTCKQASQLISQSLDRPLTLTDRLRLRLHLVICDACMHFKQQMAVLQTVLRRLREQTESDDGVTLAEPAKARIRQRLASK
jgi:predicted anti-sigma-YlaC factor YlaD